MTISPTRATPNASSDGHTTGEFIHVVCNNCLILYKSIIPALFFTSSQYTCGFCKTNDKSPNFIFHGSGPEACATCQDCAQEFYAPEAQRTTCACMSGLARLSEEVRAFLAEGTTEKSCTIADDNDTPGTGILIVLETPASVPNANAGQAGQDDGNNAGHQPTESSHGNTGAETSDLQQGGSDIESLSAANAVQGGQNDVINETQQDNYENSAHQGSAPDNVSHQTGQDDGNNGAHQPTESSHGNTGAETSDYTESLPAANAVQGGQNDVINETQQDDYANSAHQGSAPDNESQVGQIGSLAGTRRRSPPPPLQPRQPQRQRLLLNGERLLEQLDALEAAQQAFSSQLRSLLAHFAEPNGSVTMGGGEPTAGGRGQQGERLNQRAGQGMEDNAIGHTAAGVNVTFNEDEVIQNGILIALPIPDDHRMKCLYCGRDSIKGKYRRMHPHLHAYHGSRESKNMQAVMQYFKSHRRRASGGCCLFESVTCVTELSEMDATPEFVRSTAVDRLRFYVCVHLTLASFVARTRYKGGYETWQRSIVDWGIAVNEGDDKKLLLQVVNFWIVVVEEDWKRVVVGSVLGNVICDHFKRGDNDLKISFQPMVTKAIRQLKTLFEDLPENYDKSDIKRAVGTMYDGFWRVLNLEVCPDYDGRDGFNDSQQFRNTFFVDFISSRLHLFRVRSELWRTPLQAIEAGRSQRNLEE